MARHVRQVQNDDVRHPPRPTLTRMGLAFDSRKQKFTLKTYPMDLKFVVTCYILTKNEKDFVPAQTLCPVNVLFRLPFRAL